MEDAGAREDAPGEAAHRMWGGMPIRPLARNGSLAYRLRSHLRAHTQSARRVGRLNSLKALTSCERETSADRVPRRDLLFHGAGNNVRPALIVGDGEETRRSPNVGFQKFVAG